MILFLKNGAQKIRRKQNVINEKWRFSGTYRKYPWLSDGCDLQLLQDAVSAEHRPVYYFIYTCYLSAPDASYSQAAEILQASGKDEPGASGHQK